MCPSVRTGLQRDERREVLLERATELFAREGYEGLSMSRLAEEAKISKALLPHRVRREWRPADGAAAGDMTRVALTRATAQACQ